MLVVFLVLVILKGFCVQIQVKILQNATLLFRPSIAECGYTDEMIEGGFEMFSEDGQYISFYYTDVMNRLSVVHATAYIRFETAFCNSSVYVSKNSSDWQDFATLETVNNVYYNVELDKYEALITSVHDSAKHGNCTPPNSYQCLYSSVTSRTSVSSGRNLQIADNPALFKVIARSPYDPDQAAQQSSIGYSNPTNAVRVTAEDDGLAVYHKSDNASVAYYYMALYEVRGVESSGVCILRRSESSSSSWLALAGGSFSLNLNSASHSGCQRVVEGEFIPSQIVYSMYLKQFVLIGRHAASGSIAFSTTVDFRSFSLPQVIITPLLVAPHLSDYHYDSYEGFNVMMAPRLVDGNNIAYANAYPYRGILSARIGRYATVSFLTRGGTGSLAEMNRVWSAPIMFTLKGDRDLQLICSTSFNEPVGSNKYYSLGSFITVFITANSSWRADGMTLPRSASVNEEVTSHLFLADAMGVFETSSFTLAAWVKVNVNDPPKNNAIIIQRSNDSVVHYSVRFAFDGEVILECFGSSSIASTVITTYGSPILFDSNWHHVSATFDSEADLYTIYIDGQVFKSAVVVSEGKWLGLLPMNSPLKFGLFKGSLDNVAIYGVALSLSEVRSVISQDTYITNSNLCLDHEKKDCILFEKYNVIQGNCCNGSAVVQKAAEKFDMCFYVGASCELIEPPESNLTCVAPLSDLPCAGDLNGTTTTSTSASAITSSLPPLLFQTTPENDNSSLIAIIAVSVTISAIAIVLGVIFFIWFRRKHRESHGTLEASHSEPVKKIDSAHKKKRDSRRNSAHLRKRSKNHSPRGHHFHALSYASLPQTSGSNVKATEMVRQYADVSSFGTEKVYQYDDISDNIDAHSRKSRNYDTLEIDTDTTTDSTQYANLPGSEIGYGVLPEEDGSKAIAPYSNSPVYDINGDGEQTTESTKDTTT